MSGWKQPLKYQDLPLEDFKAFAEKLTGIGYCPTIIAEALGLSGPGELYPLDYRYLPRWDDKLISAVGKLAAAIRLLILGLPVTKGLITESLGGDQVNFLLETRLAFESSGVLHPRLSLVPFDDLLIATDRLFMNADPESIEQGLSSDNCVWRLDRTTWLMAEEIKVHKAEHALDLGSGSGILSLSIAKNVEKVTGVDINPRAVNVAGFNAKLNGIGNVEFTQGDLFRPIEGRSFDLIFSNPPSAPGLVRGWNREGGATGREMVEETLSGLKNHLKPGGRFITTVHFGYREVEEPGRWAEECLGERSFRIQTKLLGYEEDAEAFALREAWQKSGPRDYGTFKRVYRLYLENMVNGGVQKVCFGLLTVEHTSRTVGASA